MSLTGLITNKIYQVYRAYLAHQAYWFPSAIRSIRLIT